MSGSSGKTPGGEILTVRGSEGIWWAWCGLKVESAVDVTQLREFRQLDHRTLHERAWQMDQAYLAGLVSGAGAVELRWVADPTAGGLELYVLGRVQASSEHLARSTAHAHLDRLLQLPEQVRGRALSGTELSAACDPLGGTGARACAEVRKPWLETRGNRPDAPARWAAAAGSAPRYVTSQPLLTAPAAPWAALARTLTAARERTVVSIGLLPTALPASALALLQDEAAVYERLSQPGTRPGTGLFADPAPLSPDPAATAALGRHRDALERYRGPVFRFRVSVASAGPLPPGLVQQVVETMSPAETAADRGYASAGLVGSALRPVPASTEEDLRRAIGNVASTDFSPWAPQQLSELARRRVEQFGPYGDVVDVREATALFRFPLAVDGAFPGMAVTRPRDQVQVKVANAKGDAVSLGVQSDGDEVRVPLGALSSHVLVVGSTGSGKTNTVLHLLEQLWAEHRVPFLVIEPVNSDRDDYRWLLDRPGFEDALVLTVGDEALAPFRLNPFEAPLGVRVATHLAGLVSCFDAAFGLTGPLPFLYRKALKQSYVRAGISPDEIAAPRHQGRWPRLRDLATVFEEMPDLNRYAGEVKANISAASRLRIESLLTGSAGSTLDAASSYPIDELLSRPVILELAAVGDDDREQALITALLLNALTGSYKATRTSSQLAHVTVVEEAHRLLRKPRPTSGEGGEQAGRAAEQFANTLAENRKYGEGLVIVEQVPSKLVEDAVKNTTTKVMHHLPSEEDREAVAASMNLTEDQTALARSMAPFTAYVTHRSMEGWASTITVPDTRALAAKALGLEVAPLPDAAEVRSRFLAFAQSDAAIWNELAPYEACDGCASRCAFRATSEVAADRTRGKVYDALKKSAYPSDEGERAELWRGLVELHLARASEYEETGQRREDLAACLFLHASRAAFAGAKIDWMVRRYRRAAVGDRG